MITDEIYLQILQRAQQIMESASLIGYCLNLTDLDGKERMISLSPKSYKQCKELSHNQRVACCMQGALFLASLYENLEFSDYREAVSRLEDDLKIRCLHSRSDNLLAASDREGAAVYHGPIWMEFQKAIDKCGGSG